MKLVQKKFLLYTYGLLLVFFGADVHFTFAGKSSGMSGADATDSEIADYTYIVDGFEVKGEWDVRYSKNRSRKIYYSEEKKDGQRDVGRSLFSWFVADGTNLTKNELLPSILHNSFIFGGDAADKDSFKDQKTIFGVRVRWDFPGYNYIDILPKNLDVEPTENRYSLNKKGRYPDQIVVSNLFDADHYDGYQKEPYILVPGKMREISVYVLSSYYPGTLEFFLEDRLGNVYKMNAGSLNYLGWRKMSAKISPRDFNNISHMLHAWPLKFKGMRVVLNPSQYMRVYKKNKDKKFYLYFDVLHVQADIRHYNYSGNYRGFGDYIWRKGEKQVSSE